MTYELLTLIAVGMSSVVLLSASFILTTKNVQSALLFKLIPFFIGMVNLVVFIHLLGLN